MYVNLCVLHMFYIQYTHVRRKDIHVCAHVHITHAEMYMHVVSTYHIHIICIHILCIFYAYISYIIIFILYIQNTHIIFILYVYDWCRLHSQPVDFGMRSRQCTYIDCAIMHVCMHHIHIYTCGYIYIHMWIYMYIYIYIYTCIYVYVCMYMCIYVYMYMYMYMDTYMCVYMWMCMYM